MKNLIELSENSLETEVLRADLPVVVDFYAPWYGPCKMLAPLLEQLAAEFQGRIRFAKANVDDTPELAATYQITGVPTLALFRGAESFEILARRRRYHNPAGARGFTAMIRPKAMILHIVIGVVVGGGLGFAYYKFVGCSTGTCPLTSNPFISTLYGMVIGALVAGSFH